MNTQLETEIKNLYEKTDKSKSLKDFSKLYEETKNVHLDTMFDRMERVRKIEKKGDGINYHPHNTDSNLTPEQRKAFKAEREFIEGKKTKFSKTPKTEQELNLLSDKYSSLKSLYGEHFNITMLDYLKLSDHEREMIDMKIKGALFSGKLKMNS